MIQTRLFSVMLGCAALFFAQGLLQQGTPLAFSMPISGDSASLGSLGSTLRSRQLKSTAGPESHRIGYLSVRV